MSYTEPGMPQRGNSNKAGQRPVVMQYRNETPALKGRKKSIAGITLAIFNLILFQKCSVFILKYPFFMLAFAPLGRFVLGGPCPCS
jgi:hypothetical protein